MQLSGRAFDFAPLAYRPFRSLILRRLIGTTAVGAYFVALPQIAAQHGNSGRSGLYFALTGVGSIVGGLVYERVPFRSDLARRYVWALHLSSLALFVPAFVNQGPLVYPAMLVVGLFEAPLAAIEFDVVDRVSPPNLRSQSVALVISSFVGGTALGSLICGIAINAWGVPAALVSMALFSLGGSLIGIRLIPMWRQAMTPDREREPMSR
ncbi:hypothetical protein GCM10028801_46000 [Nocardioides maradonensis]